MSDIDPILVTGGGSGIGAAIAASYRQDGRRVIVWDRTAVADDDSSRIVELTDESAVLAAAEGLPARLSTVIHCAGVASRTSALDTPLRAWRELIDINVTSAFIVARAVHDRLVAASGVLVTIGSVAGSVPFRNRSAYCTSKAAIIMLSRVLAAEWGSEGVRVVCVSPGFVDGGMARRGLQDGANDMSSILDHTPTGRLVGMDRLVGVVRSVSTPTWAAVTGTEVVVDEGYSVGVTT